MEKLSEGKSERKGELMALDELDVPKLDDEMHVHEDDDVLPLLEKEIHETTYCGFACCCDEVEGCLCDRELHKCYLNPPMGVMENPVTVLSIQQHQFQDVVLNAMRNGPGLQWMFPVKCVQRMHVTCHGDCDDAPEGDWRTVLPDMSTQRVIG